MATKQAPRSTQKPRSATAQDVIEAAQTFLMHNVAVGQLRVENVSNIPDEGWRVQFVVFVENPHLTVAHGDVKKSIYDQINYTVKTDPQGNVLGMSTA